MTQNGQVFQLKSKSPTGALWAFRYRAGGRGSQRTQRGGFATEEAARAALALDLERVRRASADLPASSRSPSSSTNTSPNTT